MEKGRGRREVSRKGRILEVGIGVGGGGGIHQCDLAVPGAAAQKLSNFLS